MRGGGGGGGASLKESLRMKFNTLVVDSMSFSTAFRNISRSREDDGEGLCARKRRLGRQSIVSGEIRNQWSIVGIVYYSN